MNNDLEILRLIRFRLANRDTEQGVEIYDAEIQWHERALEEVLDAMITVAKEIIRIRNNAHTS